MDSDTMLATLMARKAFADRWCAEHGKDRDTLSMQDILAIRRDPRWISPLESPPAEAAVDPHVTK